MKKTNDELAQLRQKIDELDAQFMTTLAERMEVVAAIGTYKKQHGLPPLDAARWEAVLASRTAAATALGLQTELVRNIFSAIHDAALKLEERIAI